MLVTGTLLLSTRYFEVFYLLPSDYVYGFDFMLVQAADRVAIDELRNFR
jgi:hypothetical protein